MPKMLSRVGVLGVAVLGSAAIGSPNPGYRGELLVADNGKPLVFLPSKLSNSGYVAGTRPTDDPLVGEVVRYHVETGELMSWSFASAGQVNLLDVSTIDDAGRLVVNQHSGQSVSRLYTVDESGVHDLTAAFRDLNGAGAGDLQYVLSATPSGQLLATGTNGVYITDQQGLITAGPLQGRPGSDLSQYIGYGISPDGRNVAMHNPYTNNVDVTGPDGFLRTLHTYAEIDEELRPSGINNLGEVSAGSWIDVNQGGVTFRGVYYDANGVRTLAEDLDSYAVGMNELGQSMLNQFPDVTIDSTLLMVRGEVVRINDLPLLLPDGVLSIVELFDLNDHGQILAWGIHETMGEVPMVLTPLPAPGGVALLGFAGLLAARRRRRAVAAVVAGACAVGAATAHAATNPGYRGELLSFDLVGGSIDFQPNQLSNTGLVGGYLSTGLVNQYRVGVYDGSASLWSQDFAMDEPVIRGLDDQGRMHVHADDGSILVSAGGVQNAGAAFFGANTGDFGSAAELNAVNASGQRLYSTGAGVYITDREARIIAGPLQGPAGVGAATLVGSHLSSDGQHALLFDTVAGRTLLSSPASFIRTVHQNNDEDMLVNGMGVNSRGEIGALAYTEVSTGAINTRVGFYDTDGTRTIIDGFDGVAGVINELGQSIVVALDPEPMGQPFLADRGELIFLNDLPLQLPDGVLGITLLIDLNDHGQVLAQGEHESLGQVYMVLTPLPAPGGALVLGFAGLLAARRRR